MALIYRYRFLPPPPPCSTHENFIFAGPGGGPPPQCLPKKFLANFSGPSGAELLEQKTAQMGGVSFIF